MLHVIFACVHNAGRSQIAAALFNAICDPARAHASSGGTAPAAHPHPEVIAVMQEVGIDLGDVAPMRLTPELAGTADLLVTMGCGEECPVMPGVRRMDWPILDPKGQTMGMVRTIRDEITIRVKQLATEERVQKKEG